MIPLLFLIISLYWALELPTTFEPRLKFTNPRIRRKQQWIPIRFFVLHFSRFQTIKNVWIFFLTDTAKLHPFWAANVSIIATVKPVGKKIWDSVELKFQDVLILSLYSLPSYYKSDKRSVKWRQTPFIVVCKSPKRRYHPNFCGPVWFLMLL